MLLRPVPLDAAWLEAAAESRVGEFLAARGAGTHLVVPGALVAALPRDPAGAFTHSTSLDDVPSTGVKTLIVGGPDHEGALLADARARWPEARVLGLAHDVLPMLATDRSPLKKVPPAFRLADSRPYAILCPARSGSTFLGSLLTAAGLGHPKEHLRHALALALRTPGVEAHEVWRQVGARSTLEGRFGTKLVAQFLVDAAAGRDFATLLAPLVEAGTSFVVLTRPALDTTVSRLLAQEAGRYHVRGEMDRDVRAAFEGVAYDYGALAKMLARNLDENEQLAQVAATLPADRRLDVAYADLDAWPIPTLKRVAAFLGQAPRLGAVDLGKLPVRISRVVDNSAAIRARFEKELAERDPGLWRRCLAVGLAPDSP